MPNYLNAPVLFGSKAYVPSKQDNIDGGAYRGNPGMTFDQTVRAVTSVVDLPSGVEQTGLRIDHDNAGVATGAALSRRGPLRCSSRSRRAARSRSTTRSRASS